MGARGRHRRPRWGTMRDRRLRGLCSRFVDRARHGARACPAIAFCTITGGWLRYLTTLVIGSLLEGKGKISI